MSDVQDLKKFSSGLTVLYVEDDAGAREQVTILLKKIFKNVWIADNGQAGLEIYQSNPVDLVISDIRMPKLSGLEMIKEIRKHNPGQHAILISAYNELEYLSEAILLGVDGFVIKPVQSEQMFATLNKSCRTIVTQQENETYQKHIEDMVLKRTFELELKAITDALTGLPNRISLRSRMTSVKHTVMLLNIDNFDIINSSYGYDFGDQVLKKFAAYLTRIGPKDAQLFRSSSDEFVFLFKGEVEEQAKDEAVRLIQKVEKHLFEIDKIELNLTCTVGIATNQANQALQHAHIAIREVRSIGKNRFGTYNAASKVEEKQKENITWTKKVKNALHHDMIIPYFQPIVDVKTQKVFKYECLARMLDEGEVVAPGQFIEQAKIVGLLPDITRTMIDKSFSFFSENSYEFSINITENDLRENYLKSYLSGQIKKYGIVPGRVTLEILENISADGTNDALDQIRGLKKLGFKIALDDFGSEKSNFHRLQEMAVDYIKIDGLYIKSIHENPNSYMIAGTITKFAHSIGAEVVAEFVHNAAVFEKIKELGVDFAQGYHFGAPKQTIF